MTIFKDKSSFIYYRKNTENYRKSLNNFNLNKTAIKKKKQLSLV